jgi:cytochrome c oxidase accessory protein FixG
MLACSGPAEVKGKYESFRKYFQSILMVIFFIFPWLRVNGDPVILMDIFNRHFVLFGYSFFSHDAPLLFFVTVLLVFSIFLVTAIFGRLWCGWTCPQTVFMHALFNNIEKIIMGPYTKRFAYYKSEERLSKKIRILFLYSTFLLFSWFLAHSFVAYFIGADQVTRYIYDGPLEHKKAFFVLLLMTLVLFFNFAFFREKLCFFICPYGRFQNALLDRNSLSVFYDKIRGEPRRGKSLVDESEKGDCVDCNRCVSVCPTKIDIRNGFQLECISCGKCIDACNDVMLKMKRPQGLIRYETANNKPITLKRFRLGLYALLIVLFSGGLIWSLNHRQPVDFTTARAHANPFSTRMDGDHKVIQNQIQVHLKNQTNRALHIVVRVSEDSARDGFKLISPINEIDLSPEQDLKTTAFVGITEKDFNPKKNQVNIELVADGQVYKSMVYFIGVQ